MLRITATLSLARALATGGPRKLRAIALDLDGTLCNSAGVVTDATAAALAAFDGTIIIATGRGKSHAAGIASDLHKRGAIVDALVCSDGAVAYAGDDYDELVFERVAAGPPGDLAARGLDQLSLGNHSSLPNHNTMRPLHRGTRDGTGVREVGAVLPRFTNDLNTVLA